MMPYSHDTFGHIDSNRVRYLDVCMQEGEGGSYKERACRMIIIFSFAIGAHHNYGCFTTIPQSIGGQML